MIPSKVIRFSLLSLGILALSGRLAMAAPKLDQWFAAAQSGNLEVLKKGLKEGIKVNTPNAEGDTALHLAANIGKVDAVKFLLSKKANPNSVNKYGSNPLMGALGVPGPEGRKASPKQEAFDRHLKVIKMLKEAGTKLNHVDNNGNTVFHRLALSSFLFSEAGLYLEKSGAKGNVKNKEGQTPWDIYNNPMIQREVNPFMRDFYKRVSGK